MAKSESKTVKQIIKQGNAEKRRIDKRIKSAKSRAGRAYYDFINSNYHVSTLKYPNGRIKLLKLSRDGNELNLTKQSSQSSSQSADSSEASRSDYQAAVNSNRASSSADSSNSNPFARNQQ